ncbi:MAG TPA: S8 family serine peptidase [Bacteroidales bacterium]|nr:S8 family serine peptidase [Bacteroidales bacterium]
MKKLIQLFSLLTLLIFISCKSEIDFSDPSLSDTQSRSTTNTLDKDMPPAIPGQLVIKLKKNTIAENTLFDNSVIAMSSVPAPMTMALKEIKATKMERLFPPAGKYEGRTRRSGMHLYMVVTFDDEIEVAQAMSSMKNIDGVEYTEPVYEIRLADSDQKSTPFLTQPFSLQRDDEMPFDDPYLKDQWHYNNTGTAPGAKMGADLNLFKAWEITTGTPNVIVCVVDGGIYLDHPDLKDNLWVNEEELNGTPGKDNDNNGYIGDVHGWCFVNDTHDIQPDSDYHGTHVAGTVAAKNNNGVGVAGVAGGDGTPNSGVRLMSAAIFRGTGGASGTNTANAIKYGADNGAVISQNSWGWPYPSTTLPSYTRAAIDYFIKYAGCDDDGNQLEDSPMKGGVVLFAAGNDNQDYNSQPASYAPVVAVTAMSTNFTKASYTTRGTWADIMAPGGDQDRYGTRAGVVSTTKTYSYYQGTSMACPHASGVAALVASRFGGMGYTNDMLKEQLYASLLPVNIDDKNPGFEGKLGIGYLDAYAAVRNQNEGKAPDAPKINKEKSSDTQYTSIKVYWEVPKDADDEQASFYKLYYSTEQLTTSNYKQKGKVVSNSTGGFINGLGKKAGDEMSFNITKLETNTHYYFTLVAFDRWKLASEPTFFDATTKLNNPPVITNIPSEPITIFYGSTKDVEYALEVEDPDGHSWDYTIDGDMRGVSHAHEGTKIALKFRPVLSEGQYKLNITVTDELGASSENVIPFQIIEITPPERVPGKNVPADSRLLGVENGNKAIDLNEYFVQKELLPITYSIKSDDGSILSGSVNDEGTLVLTPHKTGETNITVYADNGHEKKTELKFKVQVTQDLNQSVYSVWPIPVVDNLNAWVNPKHKNVTFVITSPQGEEVFNQQAPVNHESTATVNLKKLAPGTYSLKLEASGEIFTKTIVKR